MAWTILIGAGLLEIVWAIALKFADGFTRFWPSAIRLAAAVMSFVMLSLALKSLPVGTAYAVWVGIGVIGVGDSRHDCARRKRVGSPADVPGAHSSRHYRSEDDGSMMRVAYIPELFRQAAG